MDPALPLATREHLRTVHHAESELHEAAAQLTALGEWSGGWALPVICIAEFMRLVARSKVFNPPSTVVQATGFIESLTAVPGCGVIRPE